MRPSQFPLLLTLFAFLLRLWRIDVQSLRGDEAFDVLFSLQPLGEIIYQDRFNQIYPPLYHTLDHFWLMIAGRSELSARFIALGAGVLLVPLTYRLAQALFSERVARVSAILVAVHPFLIWHSQDGRMYTLLAMFATMATLFAVKIWDRGQRILPPLRTSRVTPHGGGQVAGVGAAWLGYIAASTLGIMNHYFAYFSVFAINVVALYLWRRHQWTLKFAAQWFAANAMVGMGALVWIVLAWARISVHTAVWIAPTSALDVLTRSLLAYSLGTTLEWERAAPFMMVFVALAVIGVLGKTSPHPLPQPLPLSWRCFSPGEGEGWRSRGGGEVLLLTLLPLLAIYLGSLFRPMYDEKFLLFIVPFYMMLVARGLLALGSLQPLGSAVIVAGMMLSLFNYQFEPKFAKSPPWREAARSIMSQAQRGDVIVYNFPDPSLAYQVGDALPILLLPAQGPYDPAGATPLGAQSAENDLTKLSGQYERIWFVPQPSPNWDKEGAVARWLMRFADRDFETSFASLKVERYLTSQAYRKIWTPLNADFADHIRLVAYRVEQLASNQPVVRLRLYWQPTGLVTRDYTVFAHLLDQAGVLRAQQDNPPVSGTYPTSSWTMDAAIVDRYDIILPDDLAAGHYRFEVGMYDASGKRLRVGDDDKLVFGDVVR